MSARYLHLPLATLLACAAARCGPTPPDERTFPAADYSYRARVLLPGARDSVDHAGTLHLSAVTPDSLVGRWEVPGYLAALGGNYFNVVSYHVTARTGTSPDTVVLVHDLRRDGDGVRCRVAATRLGYLAEGRCSLERR